MTNEEIAQVAALIAAALQNEPERKFATLERAALAQQASIEGLARTAEAHQASINAHDAQIEALIKISEENARNWEQLHREWQAYLNTQPKH